MIKVVWRCVSHPIIIHVALIQGAVAMAAAASVARDVDAFSFQNEWHTQVTSVTTRQKSLTQAFCFEFHQ